MADNDLTATTPVALVITDEMLDAGAGEVAVIFELEDGPYAGNFGDYARRIYLAMAALDPDRKPRQS